jgi:ribosomal protein S27E
MFVEERRRDRQPILKSPCRSAAIHRTSKLSGLFMSIRCRKCSHVNRPDADNRMKPWCVGCGAGLADSDQGEQPETGPAPSADGVYHPPGGLIGMPVPQVGYRARRRASPDVMLGISLVMISLGVASVAKYSENTINGWASRNWPKTRGLVARSWLEEWVSTKSGHISYLRAVYTYEIAGIRYENDKVEFTSQIGGGGRAYGERELARIAPAGQPCDVYYNPNRPSLSCLVPGVSALYLTVLPFVTLFFFLIGVVGLWTSVRQVLGIS